MWSVQSKQPCMCQVICFYMTGAGWHSQPNQLVSFKFPLVAYHVGPISLHPMEAKFSFFLLPLLQKNSREIVERRQSTQSTFLFYRYQHFEMCLLVKTSYLNLQYQIPYDITFMQNLKYDTNELVYKAETDSQIQKINLQLPKGKWGGGGINQEFELADTHHYL